jgi:hypothetical protein
MSSTLSSAFTAVRISKSATIVLDGMIDTVFPLFTPVQEKVWAEGWEPEIQYSQTEAEVDMIFCTAPRFADEERYTWILSLYNIEAHELKYTVLTSERLWFITIRCEPFLNNKTKATITYTYTGLSQKGNDYNQLALQKMFAYDLNDWAEAINYYLKNGRKLTNH